MKTSLRQMRGGTFPVDHVSRLIEQEALTIRHSDAKELAVSLKVDGQTQLF